MDPSNSSSQKNDIENDVVCIRTWRGFVIPDLTMTPEGFGTMMDADLVYSDEGRQQAQ